MIGVAWVAAGCGGPGAAGPGTGRACGSEAACEARAAARLEAVRGDAAGLEKWLGRFPKGADLHNHLSGAVYAESYLAWAREDGFRIDDSFRLIDASKCGAGAGSGTGCAELPASPDDPRFDAILRAWSMKDFKAGAQTGHDHFFEAFGKFKLVSHEDSRDAAMLAETVRRAAADGAIYLEVLVSLARGVVDIVGAAGPFDATDLAGYERRLHADPRWTAMIAAAHDSVVRRDRQAREALRCGTPEAGRGCEVTVRYLGQVGRTEPAAQVFAELLASFEVGTMEPRIVGVNLVAPEDDATALADYDLQMSLIAAVAEEFKGRTAMHVTLHAGELTAAIAPAASLVFHIRHAVEIARAERIGHGVDVLSERDAPALLAEMRERGVAVEVCLTSNAVILDVSGAAHPLAAYLRAGVPVALATDDAGVSRSSLTGELVRAVAVQGLTYPQIKALVRSSLSVAFVPGASLWTAEGPPHRVADCAGEAAASPEPRPGRCAAFLAGSERARLQWKLEGQLGAFEAE